MTFEQLMAGNRKQETETANILIVDDEASIRSLLGRILENKGYHCAAAADAEEAWTCMRGKNFDLVVSDINMPGKSGLDLIRDIKDEYPDVAVVIVSIIEDENTARTAMEFGVYGYIIKPFDKSQILISVANALRRQELEKNKKLYHRDLEQTVLSKTAMLIRANEKLKKREAELCRKTEELNELNSALKVLLKRREQDNAVLEERVLSNIKSLSGPYLEKLKLTSLNNQQMTYLGFLESSLNDIVSSFTRELSSKYLSLSPTEIQVANLIREGKSTKEIADLLNLSANTIISHRYKIRSKLRLKNKKTNLRAYLQSIK